MALAVGSPLGHYDVTALIGEGRIGQVYQAGDAVARCSTSALLSLILT